MEPGTGDKNLSDKELVKMAFGDQPEIKHQDSLNKTVRGFVKGVQKQAVVLAKGLMGKSAVPNVKNDE